MMFHRPFQSRKDWSAAAKVAKASASRTSETPETPSQEELARKAMDETLPDDERKAAARAIEDYSIALECAGKADDIVAAEMVEGMLRHGMLTSGIYMGTAEMVDDLVDLATEAPSMEARRAAICGMPPEALANLIEGDRVEAMFALASVSESSKPQIRAIVEAAGDDETLQAAAEKCGGFVCDDCGNLNFRKSCVCESCGAGEHDYELHDHGDGWPERICTKCGDRQQAFQ